MNVDILCPQCGTQFTVRRELLGKRTKCTRCGTAFVIAEPAATSGIIPKAAPAAPPITFPEFGAAAPHQPAPPIGAPMPPVAVQPAGVTPAEPIRGESRAASTEFRSGANATRRQRFPFLRLVARAYEILAIIAVAIAAFQFIAVVVMIIRNPSGALVLIPPSVVTVFGMVAAAVTLAFGAQMIRLALQVEQNTSETRDACQQLADHLGGVEHEP